MAKVVIIGAGLTGLSTAFHLEQQGFFDYLIFEQEADHGGLCRSVRKDGFTFDYTGHFFHSNCSKTRQFLSGLMQSAPLYNHTRKSYIYSQKTYTPYPYQTNLWGLDPETIIECITGFVQRKPAKKNANFDTWVNTHFGTGFAKHFFFPYQEKIFDYPIHKLRTGWVGSVPQTTLEDILKGALQERDIHSIGYNAQFWYPKAGGIDHLIQAFGNALKNTIYKNCCALSIDATKKTVTLSDGHIEPYEHLVSTMPLNNCLRCIGMHKEAKKLLCNRIININLGIKREELSQKHWIYYPEKQYPFFRIGLPYTLGSMAPAGCSSLSIEIATMADQTPRKIKDISNEAIRAVQKLFNFNKQDIVTEQILLLPHAYVIYNAWREKHIDALLAHLDSQSIYSIGRYGAWKYSSMQDAIQDGQLMADKITALSSTIYKPAKLIKQDSSKNSPTANKRYPISLKETS